VPGTRIRDNADFERHVDYIHFNPVKHGYVTRVCDWPYSSFHRYVQNGLLPADWAAISARSRADSGVIEGLTACAKSPERAVPDSSASPGDFAAPYEAEIACYYFGPPK
jgi:hypothetical protein